MIPLKVVITVASFLITSFTSLPFLLKFNSVNMNSSGTWQLSKTSNFWDQIAEKEHILHIYKDEENFLDMLAGFVGGGINAGDCVMVIATPEHLQKLEKRLRDHVVGVELLRSGELYIPVDAVELVSRIMVNGWPDSKSFLEILSPSESVGKKNKGIWCGLHFYAIKWIGSYNTVVGIIRTYSI